MAEDSALTRFANSEIHQNVAETQRHDQPAGRRRQAGRRRVVGPDRRRGPAPPGRATPPRSPGSSRSSRTGAACPGRPRSATSPAAYSRTTAEASPEFRAEAVRAVIGAADDAGVTAYGSFATGTESIAVANSNGVRAAGTRTTVAAHHGLDGAGRRQRLRRGGRGRRLDDRCRGARPRGRRARHGRRPTRSPSSPATTRSCSRNTPSSTCSTCSATSGSRRSPSRRSAASSSPASGSAATS